MVIRNFIFTLFTLIGLSLRLPAQKYIESFSELSVLANF